ncbi:hypothetical protein [Trinickia mobilis]|uniref:hypothetical protein n=1 Tax=Trinickia mobilis TaxID=2816356 RepID=UPI001A8CBE74|nr:hypothetical protein [Trinickia mobilis]
MKIRSFIQYCYVIARGATVLCAGITVMQMANCAHAASSGEVIPRWLVDAEAASEPAAAAPAPDVQRLTVAATSADDVTWVFLVRPCRDDPNRGACNKHASGDGGRAANGAVGSSGLGRGDPAGTSSSGTGSGGRGGVGSASASGHALPSVMWR